MGATDAYASFLEHFQSKNALEAARRFGIKFDAEKGVFMKNIEKYAACALFVPALFLMVLTAGCEEGSRKTAAQTNDAPVIGVFLYNRDVYISSVAASLEAALTGKAQFEVHSAQNDQLDQNEQIDAMLAHKTNVLVVNLVDMQAAGHIADKAKKAGIPVVFFNREPDLNSIAGYENVCYVGTKAHEAGELQGEIIKRLWSNHPEYDRNGDGKFQYIMIQANPDHPEAIARSEHSVRQARKLGVPMEQIGGTLLCDWDEALAFEAVRLSLPALGEQLELVIANNDSMALGAAAALAEIGFNTGKPGSPYIPVVGVDATEQALDAVRRGVMSGTVKQDGRLMGEVLAKLALNAAAGKNFLEGASLEWDGSGVAVRLPYFALDSER